MNNTHNNIGRKVSFGGIITALSLICLYMSNILPTNRLLFYAISSMFISAIVIEIGVPTAVITCIAIDILAFTILPNKILLIPYILFFGYYGILKYYIEKLNHIVIEWVIKILYYNSIMALIYYIVTKVMGETINIKNYLWFIIILLEVAFIIYDIGYSLGISYYNQHIRKRIKKI